MPVIKWYTQLFHINLYADESYLLDVDPLPTGDSTDTAKFKVLENTPKGPQLMVVDKVESG